MPWRTPARGGVLLALLLLVLPSLALAQAEDEPLAFFTIANPVTATGRAVRVDAAESRPSSLGTNITEYAWRWNATGDYEPGNATTQHNYSAAGVHLVGLRVTDDAGAVAFANQSVLVKGSLPEAYFQLAFSEEDDGLLVQVNATFSSASRGASRIVSYEWDWDGPDGPLPFAEGKVEDSHFYEKPGAYTILLRVTDDQGRVDTTSEPIVFRSTFFTRMAEVLGEWDAFLRGAWLTLRLAVVATAIGFALAVLVAMLRISHLAVLRWPALAYIEVIRGTPLFVQILAIWLVLPEFGIRLGILYSGALALIVNTSAYQAEAIRGGIQSIPTGQMEAATSLGMTYLQAMRHVVVPQAFRLTLPPLGNEFIILLKDTSLLSVIGVFELTQVGRVFSANTFLVLETWIGVAAMYFVMTYTISVLLRRWERKLAIPGLGLSGAPA